MGIALTVIITVWLIVMIKITFVAKYRIKYLYSHDTMPDYCDSFNRQVFHPLIWTYDHVVKDFEKLNGDNNGKS